MAKLVFVIYSLEQGIFSLPSACRMTIVFCLRVPSFCNRYNCLGFVPLKEKRGSFTIKVLRKGQVTDAS